MKEFIIDRSIWRSGGDSLKSATGDGPVRLLNNKGFMCCLGQVAHQCGVNKSELCDVSLPDEISSAVSPVTYKEHGCAHNSVLSIEAVEINDDEDLTIPQRERELRKLFKGYGYKLKFTGKSVR